jgi:hypothetical protein
LIPSKPVALIVERSRARASGEKVESGFSHKPMRPLQNGAGCFDAIKTPDVLECFQEKWTPFFRFENTTRQEPGAGHPILPERDLL